MYCIMYSTHALDCHHSCHHCAVAVMAAVVAPVSLPLLYTRGSWEVEQLSVSVYIYIAVVVVSDESGLPGYER
jgi:hypothetical protein